MEVRIPGLGDIDEVEVIEICVSVGDAVAAEDSLLVIESDKASMDIPAPVSGVVTGLHVQVGDRIGEDVLVAVIEGDAAGTADAAETVEDAKSGDTPKESAPEPAAEEASAPAEPAPAPGGGVVEVLVPDLGDAADVTVVEVAVKPGDAVETNDLLIVLESDKASMEIAAEFSGEVLTVDVSEGQEVLQGALIATISSAAPSSADSSPAQPVAPATAAPGASTEGSPAPKEEPQPTPEPAAPPSSAAEPAAQQSTARVYAGPAVRRLSRELGVDLAAVTGTGNRGRITKDDVKAYVKSLMQSGGPERAGGGLPEIPVVDFSRFGAIEVVPRTRVQRRGADNLHRSWVNLPHVTQHDDADVSDLEDFRASLKKEAERKGLKLTPLAFIVKACCYALDEYPMFNASLLPDGESLAVKKYINIGLAVDTPEGLVVPVIREADNKSIWALCEDIERLSDAARDRKLAMDDVQGGTFSVSSLGAIGGTGFTPIVNAPEVAILGVARMQVKPVWNGAEFAPRKMLPLSLSYDHRVINGADGGRFMSLLTALLGDVRRLTL